MRSPRSACRGRSRSALPTLGLAAFGLAVARGARRGRPWVDEARARARVASRRTLAAGALVTLAAVVLAAGPVASPAAPDRLTVSFLDVGQGDATLVQHPDGSAVLFDGGPRRRARDAAAPAGGGRPAERRRGDARVRRPSRRPARGARAVSGGPARRRRRRHGRSRLPAHARDGPRARGVADRRRAGAGRSCAPAASRSACSRRRRGRRARRPRTRTRARSSRS